jgi:hypothetical protein
MIIKYQSDKGMDSYFIKFIKDKFYELRNGEFKEDFDNFPYPCKIRVYQEQPLCGEISSNITVDI